MKLITVFDNNGSDYLLLIYRNNDYNIDIIFKDKIYTTNYSNDNYNIFTINYDNDNYGNWELLLCDNKNLNNVYAHILLHNKIYNVIFDKENKSVYLTDNVQFPSDENKILGFCYGYQLNYAISASDDNSVSLENSEIICIENSSIVIYEFNIHTNFMQIKHNYQFDSLQHNPIFMLCNYIHHWENGNLYNIIFKTDNNEMYAVYDGINAYDEYNLPCVLQEENNDIYKIDIKEKIVECFEFSGLKDDEYGIEMWSENGTFYSFGFESDKIKFEALSDILIGEIKIKKIYMLERFFIGKYIILLTNGKLFHFQSYPGVKISQVDVNFTVDDFYVILNRIFLISNENIYFYQTFADFDVGNVKLFSKNSIYVDKNNIKKCNG